MNSKLMTYIFVAVVVIGFAMVGPVIAQPDDVGPNVGEANVDEAQSNSNTTEAVDREDRQRPATQFESIGIPSFVDLPSESNVGVDIAINNSDVDISESAESAEDRPENVTDGDSMVDERAPENASERVEDNTSVDRPDEATDPTESIQRGESDNRSDNAREALNRVFDSFSGVFGR